MMKGLERPSLSPTSISYDQSSRCKVFAYDASKYVIHGDLYSSWYFLKRFIFSRIIICSTVRETNNFLPCFSMQRGITFFCTSGLILRKSNQPRRPVSKYKANVAICQGGIPNLSCLFEAVQVLCFFADPDVVYPREDTKKYV